jgi:transcriptional regulator
MPRKPPVSVPDRLHARILDLHEKGVGRNDIARALGTSTATVSRAVRAAGREFTTTRTHKATEQRVADLADIRARVALKLIAKADQLLDEMDDEYLAYAFGGKDNEYNEHLLERAPVDAVHKMMQATSIAVQRNLELVRFDSDQGAAKAGNLIDALAAGIEAAAAVLDDQPSVTDSP